MTTSAGVAAAADTVFRQSELATDAFAAVRAVDNDDNQAGYRAPGKRVVLRDGSTVLIRPVRGTDAPLLADGFARLSNQARQAGADRFTALVPTQNAAIAGLLGKLGACLAGRGPGTVEYEVALLIPPGDPGYDQTPQLVSQPC